MRAIVRSREFLSTALVVGALAVPSSFTRADGETNADAPPPPASTRLSLREARPMVLAGFTPQQRARLLRGRRLVIGGHILWSWASATVPTVVLEFVRTEPTGGDWTFEGSGEPRRRGLVVLPVAGLVTSAAFLFAGHARLVVQPTLLDVRQPAAGALLRLGGRF